MPHNFLNRDIISITDLSKSEMLHVLDRAARLKKKPEPNILSGRVMGSCFFEPSTRTRLSFETAMQRLGGTVVGFADPNVTSTKKGETLHDSMRIIGQYADVIVIRHPLEGAARRAAEATETPIVNAGDGANQHPTQTLLDLFTIKETQKKLDGLHIAMIGDLKYGRTVHSLAQAMKHFDARFYFVAPESLQMPSYICDELKQHGIKFSIHERIEEVMKKADILYMTRIQEERFPDKMEYQRLKHVFELTPESLSGAQPSMRILHPLPRVNEIHPSVDDTPHAYYFEEAQNGLFVRQAVLSLLLSV
ncbi:MAG: aspartate carbamoyltransferase [Patescibacteria group bacterium]